MYIAKGGNKASPQRHMSSGSWRAGEMGSYNRAVMEVMPCTTVDLAVNYKSPLQTSKTCHSIPHYIRTKICNSLCNWWWREGL